MGELGAVAKSAIPALKEAQQDDSEDVRAAAAKALEMLAKIVRLANRSPRTCIEPRVGCLLTRDFCWPTDGHGPATCVPCSRSVGDRHGVRCLPVTATLGRSPTGRSFACDAE